MNVVYCLRHARQVHGDKPAFEHERRRVTWREFHSMVENSARRLRELGIQKGDRVAVLMANSPAFLDLYYSIAMAGAIIVPLNTRWAVQEMRATLEDSGSKLLLVDEQHTDSPGGTLWHKSPDMCSGGGFDYDEPDENDVAGLFYTSGTTGGPKGATLTHRNIYSNALHGLSTPPGLLPGARYLHAAPMFHLADAGFIHMVTLMGGCHCFVPGFEPKAVLEAIERHRITDAVLLPTMINMLLNHPGFGQHDVSSLYAIRYGGSPMPLSLLEEAMKKLGCSFAQAYGMTETSPLLTMLAPADHCLDGAEGRFAPVKSAGRPIPGVEVRVVDDQDRDVPAGEIGEIVARGPNVMKGYWNRPEINAEVLRGGWMHTGDLGHSDERSFLYISDRKKDMIKTGGENVYSPEVEAAIVAHPAVLEGVVIGYPDALWGESIRAVVVLRAGAGADASAEEIIRWCRERLTHFKCPRSVVFTDVLPKGGTGKVQKQVLRARFASVH
jgi:long-chain acyl-CoA synthetase